MKKWGRTAILAVLIVILSALLFVACDKGGSQSPSENDNNGNQEHQHTYSQKWNYNENYHWHEATCEHDLISDKDEHNFDSSRVCTICGYRDTALHGVELKTNTLSINGANISGKVSNETTLFSFVDEISVADSATYTVSTDINGSHTIRTKTVNLAIGDNTFYILVENGKDIKLYTVSIRRRPIYTVTFDSKGGTAVEQQQVEEDGFAVEPNTTRIGYDFDKWDYDLSKPILKDETITASWSAIKYTITYLLDGGVNNSDNPLTYTIEDEIKLLPPTKVGYTGIWNNDGKIEIGSTGNKTFTASYTINQYKVTVTPSIQNSCLIEGDGVYDYNSEITVAVSPFRGYDFLGWYNGDVLLTTEPFYTLTISTNDLQLIVKTAVKEEMQGFDFSSTTDTCTIIAVADKTLKSVGIPDYVTDVEKSAFSDCSSLERITVSKNSTRYSSQDGILYDKEKTKFILIPNRISGTISIPETITSIGNYTFSGRTALESVIIPDSVKSIGGFAFSGCSLLHGITIPNGVTSIDEFAFKGCTGLISIIIPNSITSIGSRAFEECDNLQEIYIFDLSAWLSISGLVSLMYYSSNNKQLFLNNQLVTSLIIPDGMTFIPDHAFYNCRGLTSVTIPNSVTSIGSGAFFGCSDLKSITIPDSVTSIGMVAFGNTAWYYSQNYGVVYAGKVAYDLKDKSFSSVVIKEGTRIINDGVFSKCTALTSITIPDSVVRIGSSAFYGCSNLTSIKIPDGVTEIGSYTFYGCSKLRSITIPESVTEIGASAFENCYSLGSIIFNGSTEQWNNIKTRRGWNNNAKSYTIYCTDGTIYRDGTIDK